MENSQKSRFNITSFDNQTNILNSGASTSLANLTNVSFNHRSSSVFTLSSTNDNQKRMLKHQVFKNFMFKTPNKPLLQTQSDKKKTPKQLMLNDRYIPNRVGSSMEASYHLMHNLSANQSKDTSTVSNISSSIDDSTIDIENENVDNIKRKLIIDTCNGIQDKTKILNLHTKKNESAEHSNLAEMKAIYGTAGSSQYAKKAYQRHVPSAPERILDAPYFKNDYYLNLLDWSMDNKIAVALNKSMYVWDANTGDIAEIFCMGDDNEDESNDDYISSTAWLNEYGSGVLAVGNSLNIVEIWDVNTCTRIRRMRSHTSRVGSLSWNNHILTSGARNGAIHHHDVRVAEHHVGTLTMHAQEVCGLKWNSEGRFLASGGNDNLVAVWGSSISHNTQPLHVFDQHAAAVKALAWCPWQKNVLATGGGTACRQIKIWNVSNGNLLQSVDAKSQISCLLWSNKYKELISSHGFKLNQLSIWKYPHMTRVCDLKGHMDRVLMMVMSPDEETVASVGADETLRLWKCFAADTSHKISRDYSSMPKSASCNSLTRSIR